ncbi:SusC/RagA family TonB-linked outer membrane protein [Butyricimonas sp. NSJ-56]|uniref:SusC/RagA family TonB-linked outer membrane protein n=2 Tax=Butyricimonas hominis TaxID=2763032 RepID=A0ABR7D4X2_9BACT|nr:SusC/RagA family TonB-linked outer membrane protein [Butyricimonas hominis]
MKKKCNSSGLMKIRLRKKLLTMKFFVLFFLLSVSVSATTYSQEARLTLSLEDVSLTEVFSAIRKNTAFTFIYNVDDVRNLRVKSLNVKDATIQQILDEVLRGTGFIYRIEDEVVVIQPQDVKEKKESLRVKGFVYDTKKQPMPGVTVKVQGVAIGTATNKDGWFALELPLLKGVLEFSFIGFKKQQVNFTEKTDTLRITLIEDVSNLDEVVVRAYGSQKKRETISAISSVKADEMKELPAASITSMLQGRLAGVNVIQQSGAPGSAAVVAVRGFNSLMFDGASDGQPLWVVDGVPMHSFVSPVTGTNTLADLDPSLIESVEVLKDAAAASIYGSRAGNGVILITTKKGKIGEVKFSANASYSLSQLMEYPEQTGGRMERWLDILQYRNTVYNYEADDGFYNCPDSYESVWVSNWWGGYWGAGTYDLFWGNSQKGSATQEYCLQDSLDPYYNNSTNWYKYAFRTGKVLNANISASGGTEKLRYMVGLGYYDETGIMINSQYSRANLISNLTANLSSKLGLDTRVYLAYTNRTMNGNSTGSKMKYEGMTVDPRQQNTYLGVSEEVQNEWKKKMLGQKDRTDDYRAMVTSVLRLKFLPELEFSASINLDYSQGNSNVFTPSYLDVYYNENMSSGAINRSVMISTEELLHYNKSIKDVHNIDILLGFNVNKTQKFDIKGYGKKGASDFIYYYDPTKAPEVVNHGTEDWPNWVSTRFYASDFKEQKMMSYFGRFGYNYKQRYLFECTLRSDGSSTFGEGNRWAVFPSFAVGWTFSEEPFVKNWTENWLNLGKIRFSYGTSGQVFSKEYMAHGLMKVGTRSFLGSTGVTVQDAIAPSLTWEKTEQYDIGLDLDMLQYRLNVKLDYYYKYTKAMIWDVPVPGALYPFSTRTENAMDVSNEGIELELEADILRESAVSWRMKLNGARNWNRFEKSYSGKDVGEFVIGRSLYGMYVYANEGFYNSDDEVERYHTSYGKEIYKGGVGVANGTSGMVGYYNLRDFNGDNDVDKLYVGSPVPVASGGWVNELKWKGFDLNILVNYSLGRKIINMRASQSFGTIPLTKLLDYRKLRRWTPTEKNPNASRWGKSIIGELDTNIEKVHSMSLKQLTLGYDLPKKVASKIGLSGLRCFVTGENLFYLSNYSGENPEIVDVYSGFDKGDGYPLPRKWTLGLTLNF